MNKTQIDVIAFLALLKQLQSTASDAYRHSYILMFMCKEGLDITDPNIKEVLDLYELKMIKKQQQGSIGGTTTSITKANTKKTNIKKKDTNNQNLTTGWIFFPKAKRCNICSGCKDKYVLDEPIVWNVETKVGYHLDHAPEEAIQFLIENKSSYYATYTKNNGAINV